ncbi:MAG TPA: BadF/BadG/BcrA/BcrD ATPase family protein, partial [Burkholderiaceae bacterium]
MQDAPDRVSGPAGLGIDAGGTQTRWALAANDGNVIAEGAVAGLTALQMATEDGRKVIAGTLAEIAGQAARHAPGGLPGHVLAGFTGLGSNAGTLAAMLAGALGIKADAVTLSNDIEIAYLDLFRPGAGFLVYAGTGSIAAMIDEQGQFQRAGGRGSLLDDGGGGYWIAREAMRQVWRREDEQPGAWEQSPMARALMAAVGGSHWDHSREFIYSRTRGEIGQLALVVAASAADDSAAREILRGAGVELARLGNAMVTRFGVRPIVLGGRAATLHPLIADSFQQAL